MHAFPWLTLLLATALLGWIWLFSQPNPLYRKHALYLGVLLNLLSFAFGLFFFIQTENLFIDPWLPFLGTDSQSIALYPFVTLIALSILHLSPKQYLQRAGMAQVFFVLAATYLSFAAQTFWLFGVAWFLSGWPVFSSWLLRRKNGKVRGAKIFFVSSTLLGAYVCIALFMDLPLSLKTASALPQPLMQWLLPLSLFAIAIRMGLFPFHGWVVSSLLESKDASLLIVLCPMSSAYALLRLRQLVPSYFLDTWFPWLGLLSAIYFFLVALGQKEQFRTVLYLVLGQMSIVFMGLTNSHQESMTGALVLWLALGFASSGILLMSWNLKARRGDIFLSQYNGLVHTSPFLASSYFLFGMGLIGLPGTLTFVAEDLICQGMLVHETTMAVLFVLVTALGAIIFLRLFALVFLGTTHTKPCADLERSKRVINLLLVLALFLPGVMPYPVVTIPGNFFPQNGKHKLQSNRRDKPHSINTHSLPKKRLYPG